MQNCKLKDRSLDFQIKTVELSKVNKVGRTIVKIIQCIRRLINASDGTRVVRLSDHIGMAGKKDLTKNIIVEQDNYKNRQVLKVKTDINNRYLRNI